MAKVYTKEQLDEMANSVILATLVYHAAMRGEKLPRVEHQEW